MIYIAGCFVKLLNTKNRQVVNLPLQQVQIKDKYELKLRRVLPVMPENP